MIVGFTGTRKGLTPSQAVTLRAEFESLEPNKQHTLVHGDCIGADAEAHAMAMSLGWRLTIYPGDIPAMRAYCEGYARGGTVWEPRPTLIRNRMIVTEADILIACPEGLETRRSGTWYTIRYARKQGIPGRIVWLNGSTSPV